MASYMAVCPACSNNYDAPSKKEINEIARRWEEFLREYKRKILKEERDRIRKGIRESAKFVKGLTPGDGTQGDPWTGAVETMRDRALEVVR